MNAESEEFIEIEKFLAECSVGERDNVIQAIEWSCGGSSRISGAPCLMEHAIGTERYWATTNARPGMAYDALIQSLGHAETVQCCKRIAACLNGCSAAEIAVLIAPIASAEKALS